MADIFSIVPIVVLADRRLTLWHMRVLIALLSFRSKNSDTVWPSRETLAERCGGMHLSNISKVTTELCELGWLTKEGTGGKSRTTRYKITVPDIQTVANSATVVESATVAKSTSKKSPTVAKSTTPAVADSATGKEQTRELTNKSNRQGAVAVASGQNASDSETELQAACRQAWKSYSDAYFVRYGAEPVRNSTVNSQVKSFVKRIGFVESPHVAAFFVQSNTAFYVQLGHQFGNLLKDAEKLRTEWVTGRSMTATRARQIDQSQANYSVVDEAMRLMGEQA